MNFLHWNLGMNTIMQRRSAQLKKQLMHLKAWDNSGWPGFELWPLWYPWSALTNWASCSDYIIDIRDLIIDYQWTWPSKNEITMNYIWEGTYNLYCLPLSYPIITLATRTRYKEKKRKIKTQIENGKSWRNCFGSTEQ